MKVELDVYRDRTMVILKGPDGQIEDRIEVDGFCVRVHKGSPGHTAKTHEEG